MLEKLWDDVVAGPRPERGLEKLRGITTSQSSKPQDGGMEPIPESPVTPTSPGSASASASPRKDNVWRSVFHPGSNPNTRGIGTAYYDKPSQPNSPTVYDWLYSGETKSQYR